MAFPIPSLPTDNLYKFMALSGLFIGVSGLFFVETQIYKNTILLTEIEVQLSNADDLLNFFDSKNNLGFTQEHKIELYDSLVETKLNSAQKISQVKVSNDFIGKRLRTIICFSWLGFLISLLGFLLWYLKVQNPLDEILRLNLKKARLEPSSYEESSEPSCPKESTKYSQPSAPLTPPPSSPDNGK